MNGLLIVSWHPSIRISMTISLLWLVPMLIYSLRHLVIWWWILLVSSINIFIHVGIWLWNFLMRWPFIVRYDISISIIHYLWIVWRLIVRGNTSVVSRIALIILLTSMTTFVSGILIDQIQVWAALHVLCIWRCLFYFTSC